jgi:predicted DCC family thiol-disulfide oxidoreductase YuxK
MSRTASSSAVNHRDLELFFDGDCPLCAREVAWLRRWDGARRIQFTDISAATFDAAALGVSHARLMARIHARLPSGQLVEGVEVFRRLYALLGFERWVRMSRWPLVAPVLDAAYTLFAKNRLRLTGRCDVNGCATHAPAPPASADVGSASAQPHAAGSHATE